MTLEILHLGAEVLFVWWNVELIKTGSLKKKGLSCIEGCFCMYIPGTQMTRVFVRKGLVLGVLTFKNRGHLGSR